MPETVVYDKSVPQGKVMDLPEDFEQFLECHPHEPIEPFLARFSPLTAHACWVYVRAPVNDGTANVPSMDAAAFQTAALWIKSRLNSVTVSEVDQVARQTHCTCGKWKVYIDAANLDKTWGRIARAVHSGALGGCSAAKVSTTSTQELRNRGSQHTVYIYVDNYLDEPSVYSLRDQLLAFFLDDDTAKIAHFKPDIYTLLGWGTGTMPPLIPKERYTVYPTCAACGKRGEKLKKCTGCYLVRYCNVDCQKKHRKLHRKDCSLKDGSPKTQGTKRKSSS